MAAGGGVDLNPSVGQKLASYQLISKFPQIKSKVTSQGTSLKESIFGSIFTGDTSWGLDYKKDVAPWLGDRIGLGVFPDMEADKKPEIGLTIAFTDQSAAKAALDKAITNAAKKHEKVGYAFADQYVVVSDTTAHATALVQAGKSSTLAGSKYQDDVQKLGSDQTGVAWADIAAVYKAVPKDMMTKSPLTGLNSPLAGLNGLSGLKGANDPKNASGRVVVGLHANASYVEVIGKGIDIKGAGPLVKADAATGAGMIASFPGDVLGAMTVKGLGKAAGVFYTSFTAGGDKMGIKPMLSGLGIDSAKKIETLLGAETGVMVGGGTGQPQFAVRTRGNNPDAALAIARKALAGVPPVDGLQVRKITGPDGIVAGLGSDLNTAIFSQSGSKLGSSDVFRQVIPDASKADVAEYVNLTKVLPLLPQDPTSSPPAWLKSLKAVGVTATGGAEPTLQLRLSFT
jgi:hypothetical protein